MLIAFNEMIPILNGYSFPNHVSFMKWTCECFRTYVHLYSSNFQEAMHIAEYFNDS